MDLSNDTCQRVMAKALGEGYEGQDRGSEIRLSEKVREALLVYFRKTIVNEFITLEPSMPSEVRLAIYFPINAIWSYGQGKRQAGGASTL